MSLYAIIAVSPENRIGHSWEGTDRKRCEPSEGVFRDRASTKTAQWELANTSSLSDFGECMLDYWNLLPTWEKAVCAFASAGCLACFFNQAIKFIKQNKCTSLSLAKIAACNASDGAGGCTTNSGGCKCGYTSTGFTTVRALWTACGSARSAYQYTCWKPTDPGWQGHMQQVSQAFKVAANCEHTLWLPLRKGN